RKGARQRMRCVAVGETLDGADRHAFGLRGEHQARAHRVASDDDRAGAADAVLAADMGAGLAAVRADGVSERAPRLDPDGMVAAVDVESDIDRAGHARFSIAPRNAAPILRGVAGISSICTPNGVSASLMALSTAAGAPIAPPSPTPLALGIEAARVGSL